MDSQVYLEEFVSYEEDEKTEEQNQVTSQSVIDSLYRYTIRPNGAYSKPEVCCSLCHCKYSVGDRIVGLPCRHNFHEYCIENWLKWVKSSCPVDRKSVNRLKYLDEVAEEKRNLKVEGKRAKEREANDSLISLISNTDIVILPHSKNGFRGYEKKEMRLTNLKFLLPETDKKSGKNTPPIIKNAKGKSQASKKMKRENCVMLSSISVQKSSSSLGRNTDSEAEDLRVGSAESVMSDSSRHRLRESIVTLRERIQKRAKNDRESNRFNSREFQNALETVMLKLSDIDIYCSKKDKNYRSPGYIDLYRTSLSAAQNGGNVNFSRKPNECFVKTGYSRMKSRTFADMLRNEKEDKRGWIYKNNVQISLSRKGLLSKSTLARA